MRNRRCNFPPVSFTSEAVEFILKYKESYKYFRIGNSKESYENYAYWTNEKHNMDIMFETYGGIDVLCDQFSRWHLQDFEIDIVRNDLLINLSMDLPYDVPDLNVLKLVNLAGFLSFYSGYEIR